PQQQGKGMPQLPPEVMEMLMSLPEHIRQYLLSLPPDQMMQELQKMMQEQMAAAQGAPNQMMQQGMNKEQRPMMSKYGGKVKLSNYYNKYQYGGLIFATGGGDEDGKIKIKDVKKAGRSFRKNNRKATKAKNRMEENKSDIERLLEKQKDRKDKGRDGLFYRMTNNKIARKESKVTNNEAKMNAYNTNKAVDKSNIDALIANQPAAVPVSGPTPSTQKITTNPSGGKKGMSDFDKAFAAARKAQGKDGYFQYDGGTYHTYYAEEWAKLTPAEKKQVSQGTPLKGNKSSSTSNNININNDIMGIKTEKDKENPEEPKVVTEKNNSININDDIMNIKTDELNLNNKPVNPVLLRIPKRYRLPGMRSVNNPTTGTTNTNVFSDGKEQLAVNDLTRAEIQGKPLNNIDSIDSLRKRHAELAGIISQKTKEGATQDQLADLISEQQKLRKVAEDWLTKTKILKNNAPNPRALLSQKYGGKMKIKTCKYGC
ncbi:MAG TPA: hypothetical protein PKD00_02480, partial [Burkholderiales bacterium]|nr:hypothetical protein [Burkholderiales bacterium]